MATPSATMGERVIFENEIGRITDRRMILESGGGHGWHARCDIPLRSISSVAFEAKRHPAVALLFAILGAAVLARNLNAGGIVLAIVLFGLAVSVFLGSRSIEIALADGKTQHIRVRPLRAKIAPPFVDALRDELFKNAPQDGHDGSPRWG